MDSDQTQLLSAIIDARRNRDTEAHTHYVLRYLSTPNDDVVYAPQGIAKIIQEIVPASKPTIYKTLNGLERRLHFFKFDEFSLQLNQQFSTKASKTLKYQGTVMFFSDEERLYLKNLSEQREILWGYRGKNNKPTKKYLNKETNMQKLIDSLTKQLDVKDQQLQVKDVQISELTKILSRIAAGGNVSPLEARSFIKVLEGGKK